MHSPILFAGGSPEEVQVTADGGAILLALSDSPTATGLDWLVKLDSSGRPHWQRELGPAAPSQGFLNAVQQTPDGGYVATGEYYVPSTGSTPESVLAVKLDAAGNLQWERAYNNLDNSGTATSTELANAILTTPDGGYILAGDGNLLLLDEAPIVPWLAKVDASGNVVWQHFYYQTYQPTGRPLSEYFAASGVTPDGGSLSLGWTENYAAQKGELFAVKTDSAGLAGSCSDDHPATGLAAMDPALTAFSPALPVQTVVTPGSASPSGTSATSIGTQVDC